MQEVRGSKPRKCIPFCKKSCDCGEKNFTAKNRKSYENSPHSSQKDARASRWKLLFFTDIHRNCYIIFSTKPWPGYWKEKARGQDQFELSWSDSEKLGQICPILLDVQGGDPNVNSAMEPDIKNDADSKEIWSHWLVNTNSIEGQYWKKNRPQSAAAWPLVQN